MSEINRHLVTLDHLGILRLEGTESKKFLQGQVTCDTTLFDANHLTHGAHCTAKGRMIANFDAVALSETCILLRAPAGVVPALLASLKKYIVFAKAEIEDTSSQYRLFGIESSQIESVLEEAQLSQLSNGACTVIDGNIYARLDHTRLECWIPATNPLPEFLSSTTESITSQSWQAEEIKLGRGWVEQETIEEFLPQMLNLQTQAINGISFKKGCYTGQEIIARMHYKGKSKRQMYRFNLPSDTISEKQVTPGTPLFNLGNPQPIGNVVNSALIDSHYELLATVTSDAVAADNISLDAVIPKKLKHIPLPYAINIEL